MVIDSKNELLMLLIGLDSVSELILDDERSQEWHKQHFMMLFNRLKEEVEQLLDDTDYDGMLTQDCDWILAGLRQ